MALLGLVWLLFILYFRCCCVIATTTATTVAATVAFVVFDNGLNWNGLAFVIINYHASHNIYIIYI